MQPQPNNGTLRLPLKPVGSHDAENQQETPADPPHPETTHSTQFVHASRPTKIVASSSIVVGVDEPTGSPTSTSTEVPAAEPTKDGGKPEGDGKDEGSGSVGDTVKGWWDWITDKVGGLWDTITGSG